MLIFHAAAQSRNISAMSPWMTSLPFLGYLLLTVCRIDVVFSINRQHLSHVEAQNGGELLGRKAVVTSQAQLPIASASDPKKTHKSPKGSQRAKSRKEASRKPPSRPVRQP
jgi:hypothetical protein